MRLRLLYWAYARSFQYDYMTNRYVWMWLHGQALNVYLRAVTPSLPIEGRHDWITDRLGWFVLRDKFA